MFKKLLMCYAIAFAVQARSQVVPTISFVNILSEDSTLNTLCNALDGNSQVYMAGRVKYTSEDIVVQCTDSSGVILWTYTYDNGGYDSPNKIRIDAAGNSYIAGVSYGGSTGNDYIIIKLDASGNEVWKKRYDRGAGGGPDEALDLCVDASGFVYVTGKSRNTASNLDAVTHKLNNSNGNILWTHIYNPYSLDDIGVCITLADNQSGVVIASNCNTTSQGTDIKVLRLNASTGAYYGWTSTANGTANANDKVYSMILAGGNVVVAGMIVNSTGGNDYLTLKIDAVTGSDVFRKNYDFSSNDYATSLVKDSTGNIAVTGIAMFSTSNYQYHTVLYDSTGTSMWVNKKTLNCTSVNVNPTIVCDTIAHHFYVSGEIQKSNRDVLVYQLTPSGNIGWEKTYNYPTNGTDVATSLVVNGIGVIFVGANTTNSSSKFNLTTIKITQTPVYFPPDAGTQELNENTFVFEPNQGQLLTTAGISVATQKVAYYQQGTNPSNYFSNTHIGFILSDKDTIQDSLARVDLRIVGGNSLADIYRYEPIVPKKHYFTTSAIGITDVVSYRRLFIPEVFPNVDLHHYSNSKGLKSYFVFKKPGESISALRFAIDGATSTTVNASGYLVANTPLGSINVGKPIAYQASYNPMTNSLVQTTLAVTWGSLGSNQYNFVVSGAVPFWPVCVYVSKPGATAATAGGPQANMYWSTWIGGQGTESLNRSRTDAKDNLYVGGSSTAINYPVLGAFVNGPAAAGATQFGVMSKFAKNGQMLYSTYYGGAQSNCLPAYTQVWDVAIDSTYNIYLVGLTGASNLQTQTISVTGALNYTANSSTSGNCMNAFIAKLSPAGNTLKFASYYGGTTQERFNVGRYKNGQIHLAGYSGSSSIPFVNSGANTYQSFSGAGMYVHMDTSGVLKHSTKLQYSIVDGDVDRNDNFYMVSSTTGAVITRTPAASFYSSGFAGYWDWGIQRFTPADSLNWSTNFGGSSNDFVDGICIRDSIMVIVGNGTSSNFPFVKAASDSGDVTLTWDDEIQLAKFDIRTGQRLWVAYHATPNNDKPYAVTIDKDHNTYVTGIIQCSTQASTLFPSCIGAGFKVLPVGGYYQQNNKIDADAFVLAYNNKNQRRWTTYFGSLMATTNISNYEYARSCVTNNDNKLFLAGYSGCTNNTLPLSKWNNVCYYDSTNAGGGDGFITMFDITNFKLVGIKENGSVIANGSLLLYPNPNSGIFNIKFTEQPDQKVNLHVINVMGQLVYQAENLSVNNSELTFDLGTIAKGVYLIQVSDSKGTRTIKMIKE